MAQRVRKPHRGTSPSSATQLPVLAALYARSPTLFLLIILSYGEKVHPLFPFLGNFLSIRRKHIGFFREFYKKVDGYPADSPCNLWKIPL